MRVSVAMISYNQEAFIGQALESVMAQECDFDFECIVGDDCSTDGTRKILEAFQERYPDRIRLVLRDHNVGSQRNLAGVLELCTGQFVAYLEGDDFWTSPSKLQRQVDFMDANPDCALCFHDRTALHEDARTVEEPTDPKPSGRSEIEDLFAGNYISACTVMYRWGLVEQLPEWWADVWIGDLTLHVLHAQHGWIGYIDEPMATYRIHGDGLWSGKGMCAQVDGFIDVLRRLDKTLGYRYHEPIERSVFVQNHWIAYRLSEAGEAKTARRYIRDCIKNRRWRGDVTLEELRWMAIEAHAPALTPAAHLLDGWWQRLQGRARLESPWALTALAAVVISAIWLKLDRLPPAWDQSWYLEGGERLFRSLVDGGLPAMLRTFTQVNPVKAPLLSLIPVPLYPVLGRSYGVASLANLALIGIGSYHLFRMATACYSRRAGIYAVALFNLFPLVIGLSREFLVELLLTVLVIVWHRYLLDTDLLRGKGVWRLGVVLGLGMLTKILFPLYVVGGTLYIVVRRIREDRRISAALVRAVAAIAGIGVGISAMWYARNLQGALGAAAGSSFGQVASDYGSRSVFAWDVLSAYWMRVAEAGLSPLLTVVLLGVLVWVIATRKHRPVSDPKRGSRADTGWVMLLWFVVPFVVLTLGVNKDVRFLMPALPALAAAGAAGLDRITERMGSGVLVTGVLVVAFAATLFGSFADPAATEGLSPVVRSFVTAGTQGQYGSYVRPPSGDLWPVSDVIDLIEADALRQGLEGPIVVPLFDHRSFNLNNIAYLRAFDGGNAVYQSGGYLVDNVDTDNEAIADERADYLLIKSGDLGPDFANDLNARILAHIEREGIPFGVIAQMPLPDGSSLTVYRRTTEEAP